MPRLRFLGNGPGAEEKGLKQTFEAVEYVFPEEGAELVLPDNICSWLSYKHPDKFEILPVASGTPDVKAGQTVAVVPVQPERAETTETTETTTPADPAPEPQQPVEPKRSRR